MLTGLSISQFTIVDNLNIEFTAGMTAITGETGAGKSIALDALGLALGGRSDSNLIRPGADKADICAIFNLDNLPTVQDWLNSNDFDTDEECLLRRVITKDGRSKAYINGQPVNLQTLKALGDQLVDIHSQHAHHQLLQREYHQTLLDAYADCSTLLSQVSAHFNHWQLALRQIQQLEEQANESEKRKEFLEFQLKEFRELGLQTGEYDKLEQQQLLLANAESLQSACQETLDICRENERQSVISQLQHCEHLLAPLMAHSDNIKDAYELINSASIQVQEACQALRQQLHHTENHNGSLLDIENRMAAIHDLARKHRTTPDKLLSLCEDLEHELAGIDNNKTLLESLQFQVTHKQEQYESLARQLTQIRETAADKLAHAVKQQLKALGMASCEFILLLNTDYDSPRSNGFESIEFPDSLPSPCKR